MHLGILKVIHTQTNGVSFSLVVGAICMVKFSYDLGKDDASSTVNITLNINSTGAKTFDPVLWITEIIIYIITKTGIVVSGACTHLYNHYYCTMVLLG